MGVRPTLQRCRSVQVQCRPPTCRRAKHAGTGVATVSPGTLIVGKRRGFHVFSPGSDFRSDVSRLLRSTALNILGMTEVSGFHSRYFGVIRRSFSQCWVRAAPSRPVANSYAPSRSFLARSDKGHVALVGRSTKMPPIPAGAYSQLPGSQHSSTSVASITMDGATKRPTTCLSAATRTKYALTKESPSVPVPHCRSIQNGSDWQFTSSLSLVASGA